MHKFGQQQYQFRLYAYGLFCAVLIGCSSPSGNYDLGQADAQIGGLIENYPVLKKDLETIRQNVRQAETALRGKEQVIADLSEAITREQVKSGGRLTTIWQLTSGLLGILVIIGTYLAWKLR